MSKRVASRTLKVLLPLRSDMHLELDLVRLSAGRMLIDSARWVAGGVVTHEASGSQLFDAAIEQQLEEAREHRR